MGVRILHDDMLDMSVLYCSTSDWAFGPVFMDKDDHSSEERAQAFCEWLGVIDPRSLEESELSSKYHLFLKVEKEYWTAKEDDRKEEEEEENV